jgi:hypothetical protein
MAGALGHGFSPDEAGYHGKLRKVTDFLATNILIDLYHPLTPSQQQARVASRKSVWK